MWNDLNGNGIQDAGEPGIPGVTVNLKDCAGHVLATTNTDANGLYQFAGLAPGNYNVQVVKPAGYTFTVQNAGSDTAKDSDADAAGNMACTTLVSGETDLTWDAGLYQPATIGDFVWNDLNGNGIQDAGEPGIPGVIVNLEDCAGHVLATTNTAANGLYQFAGLTPGNYNVQVVKPAGYTFTLQNAGSDTAKDSDADAAGNMACTTLSRGRRT